MASLFPALVALLVVLAIGLYIGNKYGRVQVRNELREFRLMLLNRKSEIEAKFKAATKKFSEAEANFLSVRLKAEKLLSDAREKADNAFAAKELSVRSLAAEVAKSHPDNHYISAVLTDAIETLMDEKLTMLLDNAPKTASYIKKKFNERARQWQLDARKYKYQVLLYESMFPKLEDYAILDESPQEQPARPSDWLSDEEYNKLTDIQKLERAQVSLDRYVKGPKSKWEVGRDYELYVGHLFRKAGWHVIQNGINARLEDLGRDLICRKDGTTLIVQCKFWSQHKEVHEKHIAQLLGTTLSYAVENELPNVELGHIGSKTTQVVPVFVTSTDLSETALRFAKALRVNVRKISFDPRSTEFPRIKCNIGKDGKIFHLPFDQLYDRVVIANPGERYATTVKEAMKYDFRRARRWMGP